MLVDISGAICEEEGSRAKHTVDKLKETLKQAETLKNQIQLPRELDQGGIEAARRCAERLNSEEFKSVLNREKERITNSLLYPTEKTPKAEGEGAERKIHLADSERIYIFVSASVPEKTLRAYVRDMARLEDPNIVIVLRGFVGDSRKALAQYYQWITVKDPMCVSEKQGNCDGYPIPLEIDPVLFRKYGIDSVPAFVYLSGVRPVHRDMSLGMQANLLTEPDAMLLTGDVPLESTLGLFCKHSDSPGLHNTLKKLQSVGFYGRINANGN